MRVLIVHDGSCRAELKAIAEWLTAAGCAVGFFDMSAAAHEKPLVELIKEYDVVLFLITQELPLADVKIGILAAKAKGKKIVGVKLTDRLPTKEFGKYASAHIAFDRSAVIANVCGDKGDWTDTKGEQRKAPKTKRHKC